MNEIQKNLYRGLVRLGRERFGTADMLDSILGDIDRVSASLIATQGKTGQHIRDNEWLMSIRGRTIIPGGACPPVGPVGLRSPPSPVLCSAQTATMSTASRITQDVAGAEQGGRIRLSNQPRRGWHVCRNGAHTRSSRSVSGLPSSSRSQSWMSR